MIEDDTAFVRNVYVVIAKSANDSFRVTSHEKAARGYNRLETNKLAGLIDFEAEQKRQCALRKA